MTEDQLQAACYQWLHNNHPQLRGLFFSVPNGSTRDIREAVKLKATGLVPGEPDCILVWPVVTGFEFKTTAGMISPAQVKVHSQWAAVGLVVYVVRSPEQFHTIIKTLLS
jgi:hypothetical protein